MVSLLGRLIACIVGQTHRHTHTYTYAHRPTTVTLAAHARRGLMTSLTSFLSCSVLVSCCLTVCFSLSLDSSCCWSSATTCHTHSLANKLSLVQMKSLTSFLSCSVLVSCCLTVCFSLSLDSSCCWSSATTCRTHSLANKLPLVQMKSLTSFTFASVNSASFLLNCPCSSTCSYNTS